MSLLLDNFEEILITPEAVDQLNSHLLQWAIQGKLVSQNSNDEPVGILLERIIIEKEQLVSDGIIQKSKPPPSINNEEILYDLPAEWKWVRFGVIADHRLGKMLHKAKNRGIYYPYLRAANVHWNQLNLSLVKEMGFEEGELERYKINQGDLLICEGGEAGRSAIWPHDNISMKYQNALHRVRAFGGISNKYLMYHLWGDSFTDKLTSYCSGVTIQHFTGKSLAKYIIGLPPVEEQHRIVEKLERLLAKTKTIKDEMIDAQELHEKLVSSVLAAI